MDTPPGFRCDGAFIVAYRTRVRRGRSEPDVEECHDHAQRERKVPRGRCSRRHAAAVDAARRARHDRHQVRLRRRACAAPARSTSTGSRRAPASRRYRRRSGKRITTIEAIGATAAGKKSRPRGLALDVPQCGYCQSGQIMSASALLATKAKPTDSDIDRRHGRQHLPLRHLSAHPRRDQEGRGRPARRRCEMKRREFLKISASGGLLLAIGLPVARRDPRHAHDGCAVRAERVPAHRSRRQGDFRVSHDRDGPGHLHIAADADCRGARGRRRQGGDRARARRRQGLRQSGHRHPDDGRLQVHPRLLRPAAPGRCNGARHAGDGGRAALEGRAVRLPRRERRRHAPCERAQACLWRARGRRRQAAGAREGRAQGACAIQARRNAAPAPRQRRQGERHREVRHRCAAAGHEVRRARPIADLRRQARLRR